MSNYNFVYNTATLTPITIIVPYNFDFFEHILQDMCYIFKVRCSYARICENCGHKYLTNGYQHIHHDIMVL